MPQDPLPFAAITSVEAEQAVLGALLLNNRVYGKLAGLLKAEHFYDPLHQAIYGAAAAQVASGRAANPITVLPAIGNEVLRPGVKVSDYLVRLLSVASYAPEVETVGEQIRDLWAMRQLVAIGGDLARSEVGHPRERLARAFDLTDQVRAEMTSGHHRRARAGLVAGELLDRIERIRAGEMIDLYWRTGFPDLDNLLQGGWYAGDLIVVGGRPGMGKTVVGCCFGAEAARVDKEHKTGALLYMLEIGEAQTAARLLTHRAYNHRDRLYYGQVLKGRDLNDEQMWRLAEAKAGLDALPIIIDDSSSLTVGQIVQRTKAEAEKLVQAGIKLGPVIIDYSKFVKASDRYAGQRVNEVGEVSAGMKQAAKDLQVPVILLHQLNRMVETQGRADKRPDLSDLRDSGDLEQDADVVIFPYRENYYLTRSAAYRAGDGETVQKAIDSEHKMELIVPKNRKGPTGTVELYCDIGCSHMSQRARGFEP